MRVQKGLLIAIICLFPGFAATISPAQQVPRQLPPEESGAGPNLVVTSVSGPATAFLNQVIALTYSVENQGKEASGACQVGLYLSTDKTIDSATDRLLKNVTFSKEMAPGQTKKTTSKVLVPINGLSGKYYYGAVVGTSNKASLEQVEIARFEVSDNVTGTVSDYQTGLTWQQGDDGKAKTWADAKQYCKNLVLGGKTEWRLPRIDELETIIDYTRHNPAIVPGFRCRAGNYWSSSAYVYNLDFVWNVNFSSGGVGAYGKTDVNYVRCVHGGP